MKDRINRWWIRIQSYLWRDEMGVTTLDWIGLTAVIITLLSIIIAYVQTRGGRELGIAVANAFDRQIARWR
ncbi:MAG: hypothetical protein ACETWR_18955 [Anaerolineae bacterium]|jgi:Flp pilus assembly pilin Flp